MWKVLNERSLEVRDELVSTLEHWLLEEYPRATERRPVFCRDRRDQMYIQWMYYEGLLGKDEFDGLPAKCDSDETETFLCIVFGFSLVDLYGLEWVCKEDSKYEFVFGLRVRGSNCILPLTTSSFQRFPIEEPWAEGERISLDQYMFEIDELLEKGVDAFQEVIEKITF